MGRVGLRERGAAALEFALVLPLLLLLVFGGIDYGFYLNDSMVLRDAARSGARAGSVGQFDPGCTGGTPVDRIACSVAEAADGATGDARVRVTAPAPPEPGAPLVVCAEIVDRSGIGFVPLPGGGVVRVRVEFPLEATGVAALGPGGVGASGGLGSFAWCD